MKTKNTWRLASKLAIKLSRGDWKNRDVMILLFAIVLAIVTINTIELFTNRVAKALTKQASELLGGDLAISSSQAIPDQFSEQAKSFHLNTAQSVSFSSMLVNNENLQLSSVIAVSNNYPLRGSFKIASDNTKQIITTTPPLSGKIWLEPRLINLLQINLGQFAKVGNKSLQVTQQLIDFPNNNLLWSSLAPKAVMSLSDLPNTQILQPGSRAEYRLLLSGNSADLTRYTQWIKTQLAPNQQLITPQSAQASLENALANAYRYLSITALLSIVLSGVAISLAATHYVKRHFHYVALLHSLGTTKKLIKQTYLLILLGIGVIAIVMGNVIAISIQKIADVILQHYTITLPPFDLSVLLFSIIIYIILLIGFTLVPLQRLVDISPIAIWQRQFAQIKKNSWLLDLIAPALVIALAFWFTQDFKLTLIIVSGFMLAIILFFASASVLLRLVQKIKQYSPMHVKLAFNNLLRHGVFTQLQIATFGLTLTVMLTLIVTKNTLLTTWREQLPADAPNYFAINIMPDEVAAFAQLLQRYHLKATIIYPMIRGRLTALNGTAIRDAVPESAKNNNALRRELNLTSMNDLPDDNKIVKGRDFNQNDQGKWLISVEKGLADNLQLQIGDTLTFRINDQMIEAKIINLRSVRWDTLRPNFFVVFPLHTLDQFPTTYITSFYLPDDQKLRLNTLIQQFPSVTLFDLANLLDQIRSIIDKLILALECLFMFILLSCACILLAALQLNMQERLEENALLRVFGITKQQLKLNIIIEHFLIGVVAGFLASVVAIFIAYIIATRLFDLPFIIPWMLLIITPWVAGLVISGLGAWGTQEVVKQLPLRILQAN